MRNDDQSHGSEGPEVVRRHGALGQGWLQIRSAPHRSREDAPDLHVTGPEGFRMEIVEDPALPAPAMGHHLHYWMEDGEAVRKWYVATLHLEPTDPWAVPGGRRAGDELHVGAAREAAGTRRSHQGPIDGCRGLGCHQPRGVLRRLGAAGVKFDVPYGRDPELGHFSATFDAPGRGNPSDGGVEHDCRRGALHVHRPVSRAPVTGGRQVSHAPCPHGPRPVFPSGQPQVPEDSGGRAGLVQRVEVDARRAARAGAPRTGGWRTRCRTPCEASSSSPQPIQLGAAARESAPHSAVNRLICAALSDRHDARHDRHA